MKYIADNQLTPSYEKEVESMAMCMTNDTDVGMSNEEEEVYASFPSPEEVRTSIWVDEASSKGQGKRNLKLVIAAGVIIAISILIGVAVGINSGGGGNKGGSNQFESEFVGDTVVSSTGTSTNNGSQPSLEYTGDTTAFGEASFPENIIVNGANSDTAQGISVATNPTTRRSTFEAVITYMINSGVSDSTAFASFGTPQFRAATWLAEQDGANKAVPTTGITSLLGYKYMTRYVMAVFFFSTDGINWDNPLDFMTEKSVCEWKAYFPNDGQNYFQKGVVCEPQANLIAGLLLDANKLGGTIPPELGMLETMEYVSVSSNTISGELPSSMCRLALLAVFEAGFNSIGGGIPTCINKMSALYSFVVSNNVMTGKLPDGIGSLQRLATFIADDNMFTGDVTSLFNSLPLLSWLHLKGNMFTGTLTDDFLANQLQLTQLDMSSNKFEGSIPAHLLSKPYLELIDLHDNLLTSMIPVIDDESDALLFLSIHNNSLTGVLPASLANLRNLNHLDVSSNDLSGDLPTEIALLFDLEYFFASANDFTPGIIPASYAGLLKLEELGLKSTNRNGAIPAFLGSLTELTLLDLDDNQLYGELPTELGQLVNLEFLLLNRNLLFGYIPTEFSGMTSLRVAFLDHNSLIGSVAPLCDLPNFNEDAGDADGTELLIADCKGAAGTDTVCECCTSCCTVDINQGECNGFTDIPNLDPTWEYRFFRYEFNFGSNTRFIASDLVAQFDSDFVAP